MFFNTRTMDRVRKLDVSERIILLLRDVSIHCRTLQFSYYNIYLYVYLTNFMPITHPALLIFFFFFLFF
jgi:hypothetical protein